MSMGKLRWLLLFLLAGASLEAAQDGYTTSYDDAMKEAKRTGKPVLAYFTGSDWCGWCKKLDQEVLDTRAFNEWASEYVVMLVLDYPKYHQQDPDVKAQNSRLMGKYAIKGYPTVLALSVKGEVMASQGYQEGGAAKWIGDLRRKVDTWMAAHPGKPINPAAYKGVPYQSKDLFASKDLRGKPWPDIDVDLWLTGDAPDTTGKTVLIELWNTSVEPCPKLVPDLNKWAEKFSKDLVVIAISNETAKTVRAFLKDNLVQYNVGIDKHGTLLKTLGVSGIPNILIVSSDGIVRWQGYPMHNVDPLTDEKLGAIISADKAGRS